MMIYRWDSGAIVPDVMFEEQLERPECPTIEAWIEQTYSHAVLDIGQDCYTFHIKSYVSETDESCLVDVEFPGETYLLIRCPHWGEMLACVKWLMDLATQERHFSDEMEVRKYLDELTGRSFAFTEVDAKARLIASGMTAHEVQEMEQRHQARERAILQRHRNAKAQEA